MTATVAFDQKLHEKGISDVMRHKIIVSLSSLLRNAVLEGHVNRNVADRYRVAVDKRSKRKLKVGVDIPTPQEMTAFLAPLEGFWRALFITAAYTGLRASELRGLRWENVHFLKDAKGREYGRIDVTERAMRTTTSDRRSRSQASAAFRSARSWSTPCDAGAPPAALRVSWG